MRGGSRRGEEKPNKAFPTIFFKMLAVTGSVFRCKVKEKM